MNLQGLPRRLLKFPFWENRDIGWVNYPTLPNLGPLQSRQAATLWSGFKNGATINAIPLVGNRGALNLRLNWLDAPTTWLDSISIHAYMGGDPIEPGFVANPINSALGQGNIQVALGDTAGDVAVKVAGAIDLIFAQTPTSLGWQRNNGRIAFNNPQTRLIMVAPRTFAGPVMVTFTGAFGALTEQRVDASVVPFVYAGCRPAPQVAHGDRFAGYAETVIE